MDQGVYKKSSNPLAEADPTRDGNQIGGPNGHAPPPSSDPKSPTRLRDPISHLRHRTVEGGKFASRNRNLLPKKRLPPICHLRIFGMRQNGSYTHVLHNQQHHVGTTPPHSKYRALLRRGNLFQDRPDELPQYISQGIELF